MTAPFDPAPMRERVKNRLALLRPGPSSKSSVWDAIATGSRDLLDALDEIERLNERESALYDRVLAAPSGGSIARAEVLDWMREP